MWSYERPTGSNRLLAQETRPSLTQHGMRRAFCVAHGPCRGCFKKYLRSIEPPSLSTPRHLPIMQATAPDDGRPQRDMAAPTPPILRLNEDYVIKIAEHIALIDYEYQRRREAGCTSGPPSVPLGPLIAFSMVNKAIREMIAPVVFRRAVLTLDQHYTSDWQRGLGIIDLHMGCGRFMRTLRWPRNSIRYAR